MKAKPRFTSGSDSPFDLRLDLARGRGRSTWVSVVLKQFGSALLLGSSWLSGGFDSALHLTGFSTGAEGDLGPEKSDLLLGSRHAWIEFMFY